MQTTEPMEMESPNAQTAMLDLRGLGTGYRTLQVLWDIELSLKKGEWLALIGPNGAGKSTLLKTIAGLLKPFQGKILYRGEEINVIPVHERVRLGISLVPEGRRLFTGMTVKENLMMGAFAQTDNGKDAEQLQKVYDLFPILKVRGKQVVGTLSGGEQQMCAIGRALMSRPKLLLVDELSLGLAPIVVEGLLDTMNAIKQEEVTLIVVEQDVNTALMCADRGYVMREGMIVKSGEARQLLEDPGLLKEYLQYWMQEEES